MSVLLVVGHGKHIAWQFPFLPNGYAWEIETGCQDWCEEESSGFDTDYAGDCGKVVGGFYVGDEMSYHCFCGCWVTEDS